MRRYQFLLAGLLLAGFTSATCAQTVECPSGSGNTCALGESCAWDPEGTHQCCADPICYTNCRNEGGQTIQHCRNKCCNPPPFTLEQRAHMIARLAQQLAAEAARQRVQTPPNQDDPSTQSSAAPTISYPVSHYPSCCWHPCWSRAQPYVYPGGGKIRIYSELQSYRCWVPCR